LKELKASNEKLISDLDCLREEIKSESDKRSAAEERNSRVPELEMALKVRDEALTQLQGKRSISRRSYPNWGPGWRGAKGNEERLLLLMRRRRGSLQDNDFAAAVQCFRDVLQHLENDHLAKMMIEKCTKKIQK